MPPLDALRDWRGMQSTKMAFESRASMFDVQVFPMRRSQGSHQGFLNLAPVVGRVASYSYQGMLAETFEHLTDVRNTSGGTLVWVVRRFTWTILEI